MPCNSACTWASSSCPFWASSSTFLSLDLALLLQALNLCLPLGSLKLHLLLDLRGLGLGCWVGRRSLLRLLLLGLRAVARSAP